MWSCAVRQARHSQNAWVRRVKHVVSRRDDPSGIWALVTDCLLTDRFVRTERRRGGSLVVRTEVSSAILAVQCCFARRWRRALAEQTEPCERPPTYNNSTQKRRNTYTASGTCSSGGAVRHRQSGRACSGTGVWIERTTTNLQQHTKKGVTLIQHCKRHLQLQRRCTSQTERTCSL